MGGEHTPGPWRYERCTIGHPDNVKNPMVCREGGYVCRIQYKGSTISGCSSLGAETLEEAEANARLIAAAPDLLAACKAVWSDWCNSPAVNDPDSDCYVTLQKVQAAIAKAQA